MANYAVIEDNKVVNIIVADSKDLAETITGKLCIEYTDEKPAGIDWTYNGSEFIAPEPVVPVTAE